jgi:hypothetical protein
MRQKPKPEKKPKPAKKDDDKKEKALAGMAGKKLPFIGRMPVFKKQQSKIRIKHDLV